MALAHADSADPLALLATPEVFGRDSILLAAERVLSELSLGRSRAFLLAGEPGVGKTRLADEVVQRAAIHGAAVHSASCHELEGAPSLWPWIQLARSLLARLDPPVRKRWSAGAGRPLLGLMPELVASPSAKTRVARSKRSQAAPNPSDPDLAADRFSAFEAVTALLRESVKASPLVLVLDDLHWADPASVLLARHAIRELRNQPIFFLATYRDTDVAANDPLARALADLGREADVYPLAGLEPRDVQKLVEHVAPRSFSKSSLEALQSLTNGNPYFVVEILRGLATENRLSGDRTVDSETLPLPLSVRHLLDSRLARLGTDVRTVLEQACVLGREFEREVLATTLEAAASAGPLAPSRDEPHVNFLGATLDEASHARLIQPIPGRSGRYRFSHDLVRETLNAGLASDLRVLLHFRAGTALLQAHAGALEDHYAVLSFHLLESAPAGTANEALDYALRGAEHAAANFSYELAAQLFERGLRALDFVASGGDEAGSSQRIRGRILARIGDVQWQAGRRREAETAFRAAEAIARRLEDPELLARSAIGLSGRDDITMGSTVGSTELLREALDGLSSRDSRLRVRLLGHLVRANYFGSNRDEVRGWAKEAMAIADRLMDPFARFTALEAFHYARLMPVDLEARLEASAQLLMLGRETRVVRFEAVAWLWRSHDLIQTPGAAGADDAITRFVALAEQMKQPYYLWLARGFRAAQALMKGHVSEAERFAFEALQLGQQARTPNAPLFFGTQLFHIREAQGRSDELLPAVAQLVEANPTLPVFRMMLPIIHMNAKRSIETRETFEQVARLDFEDVPLDIHRLPMMMVAATVAAYLGDTRRAEILWHELALDEGRIAVGGNFAYWEGPVDRNLGQLEELLGRLDDAVEHFRSAIRLTEAAGAALMEAHSRSELARVLRRRGRPGDREEADLSDARAEALYSDCGVKRDHVLPVPLEAERASTSSGIRGVGERESSSKDAARVGPSVAKVGIRGRLTRGEKHWTAEFAGQAVEIPNMKGLIYLHRLVSHPEQEIHALELVALEAPDSSLVHAEQGPAPRASQGFATRAQTGSARLVEAGIESLDATALRSYRARLRELVSLRNEAEQARDLARLEVIEGERAQIEHELAAGLDIRGRLRRSTDPVERARKAVRNRIRGAIREIASRHPDLGHHLSHSIRTGSACAYRPEVRVDWSLD